MNLLIVLGVAASSLCLLWAVQSVALVLAGEPLAWPLRFKTRKPSVKWTSRVMIHATWLIILVSTPLALGVRPLDWLHQEFPTPVPWHDIAVAFSIMFFPTCLMYAAWITAGWVRIELQHDQATRRSKLFRRFLGPWPLATLEEAVFRGVLLEQLLLALPYSGVYTTLAIVLSSVVFASVHFIKKSHPGKPIWQPAYGLFIIGCLLGLAYVVGNRSLWLPIVMHASAVLVIEVMKLYVAYQAPAWLVGYAEYPQSGLAGSFLVLGAAIALIVLI